LKLSEGTIVKSNKKRKYFFLKKDISLILPKSYKTNGGVPRIACKRKRTGTSLI